MDWVGADIERSPEVAERTREDAEFVTFDGESLPFEDASFDLVYCKQVLEHVRRPEPLVAEVARVLRAGGLVRRLDLAARGLPLAQHLQPHALRASPCSCEQAGLELARAAPGDRRHHARAWRALGMPRFFARWWARESPRNRVIELGRAPGPAGCPHPQPGQADAVRPVRVPGPPPARSRSAEGDARERANREVMPDLTAKRTLVKSPPELWEELSEVERLAKHLDAFGEIRITKLEPEHTVAWEGEHASGTVSIEPSGWGTKVTLTAELPEQADEPPRAGAGAGAEPEPEPEPEPAIRRTVVEPEPEPVRAQPAPPAAEEPPAPRRRRGFWARLFRERTDAHGARAGGPGTRSAEPEPPERRAGRSSPS